MTHLECALKTATAGAFMLVAAGCVGENNEVSFHEETDEFEHVDTVALALSGLHRIRPRHSGKCIDVRYASSANGAEVIQYSCHGGNNQIFQFEDLANGYHQIRAHHSNKCLSVVNASSSAKAAITQYQCHQGTHQQFKIRDVGRGYVQISSRNASLCFDIKRASSGGKCQQV